MITDESVVHGKFKFDISCFSHTGSRPVNEDSHAVAHDDRSLLLCVADGLGAHGGGDVASKLACDIASQKYMELPKPNRKGIYNIFKDIDAAIVEHQTDEVQMKTTFASVLCRNGMLRAAHIGDTRIYFFKNGRPPLITADHSVAFEEVMKQRGTLDDIRINPGRHILKAALGGGAIYPDTHRMRIKNNLSVLICSDGFWEYVHEEEMLRTLVESSGAHEWLESMLKIYEENVDETNDNYTAVCLRITRNPV